MRVAEGPAPPDSPRSKSGLRLHFPEGVSAASAGLRAGRRQGRCAPAQVGTPIPTPPAPAPARAREVRCRNISQGLAWWSRFPGQGTPQRADPHVRIWFRSGQHKEDRDQPKVDKGIREVLPGERRPSRRGERNRDAPQVLSRRQVGKGRSRVEDRAITGEGSVAVLRPRERYRC